MSFSDDDLKRLKELNRQAFKAPWKPCEHGAESPYIFGSDDNPTLGTLFWPAHPIEETERAENQTYATADLICELRNKCEALLVRLEAAERIAVLAPARWGLSETLNGLVEVWRKSKSDNKP